MEKLTEILLENALDLINRKDTEIDILIRKKEALRDEIAELQAENSRLQNLIASLDTKAMTPEKAIEMIDKYLQEPNSIAPDWVAVLKLCRKALRL